MYEWAGTFRTVNLSKAQDLFALHQHIAPSLAEATLDLAQENYLVGISRSAFPKRAAYYFGEINAIHPFREGNGRAQREFFRQLALRLGLWIDWSRVSGPQMIEASRQSLRGNNEELEQLISQALRPSP